MLPLAFNNTVMGNILHVMTNLLIFTQDLTWDLARINTRCSRVLSSLVDFRYNVIMCSNIYCDNMVHIYYHRKAIDNWIILSTLFSDNALTGIKLSPQCHFIGILQNSTRAIVIFLSRKQTPPKFTFNIVSNNPFGQLIYLSYCW